MDILTDIGHYEAFFQSNTRYYIDRLHRYQRGEKYTFNIAAFFLGLIWMLYRKMYLEAFIVVLILIVEGMIEEAILADAYPETQTTVSLITTLGFSTIIGFTANYFYIRKAERTIQKAVAQEGSHQTAEEYLQKKGGTSWLAVPIALVLVIAAIIFLSTLPAE